jgi:hypothetical protein
MYKAMRLEFSIPDSPFQVPALNPASQFWLAVPNRKQALNQNWSALLENKVARVKLCPFLAKT